MSKSDTTTKLLPVPVKQIIWALEREARNTDTDCRWVAACELRRMPDWEARTLMCEVLVEFEAEVVQNA